MTEQVKQLEDALEAAARERQEILEAAEKEIDYHRSIAAELETSMINDFEWKLHEIEKEYNRKLREGATGAEQQSQPSTSRRRSPLKSVVSASTSGAGSSTVVRETQFDNDMFDMKLQQAKNEIIRQKDGELAKMHIQVIAVCIAKKIANYFYQMGIFKRMWQILRVMHESLALDARAKRYFSKFDM